VSEIPAAVAVPYTGAAVGDYIQILKPRVMSLVVFTGIVGLVMAPGHLHPVLAAVAVMCIAVGAGASAAINNWYDRDIDAVMRRTALRPLPARRMMPGEALGFGVVLAVGAVAVMGLAVNLVAAQLLALTIAFYVFVYTIWLKRRTPQNIVRRGGRRAAAAYRLGRGHRRCRLGRGRAVRHRVFLDAAAFLGAVAHPRRGIRRRRGADAAGRRRRARD
jgi:heme O synthase-like polyprenyltransferase